jgi:excisionase family DNA binding protein
MTQPPEPRISVAEAAKRLQMSIFTVYRAIKRGEMPAVRLGGPGSRRKLLIAEKDVENALKRV